MKDKLRGWLTSSSTLAAVGIAAGIAGVIIFILIGYGYEWTGFGEYVRIKASDQEEFQRRKTLWDWLQLLIVPIVLAVGAYLFNRAEKRNELAIAEDNQREAALQTYFDRMSELVLDKNLRDLPQDDAAWAVAQARTETTLERLDTERKARLVRFLGQAQLLNKQQAGIDLEGANLEGADLKYAKLAGANLGQAHLAGANLGRAHLEQADLGSADLKGAILMRANLERAGFVLANLKGAVLFGAELKGAVLRYALLQEAVLRYALLQGAVLEKAKLEGADLKYAKLAGAILRGADLRGVINLTREQLQEAITDDTTQLPDYLTTPSEQQAVGQPSEADMAGEQKH